MNFRFLCHAWLVFFCSCGLFAAPTLEEIQEQVGRLPAGHPRLMAGPETFAALRSEPKEPRMLALRAALIADAEKLLKVSPVEYRKTGRRLLSVSREALRRVSTLALAYQITGDRRCATRAEAELQAVCAFADWNPSHFLDTAEMTLAVALGYDWLFEPLGEETRILVRESIRRKGIEPSFEGTQWWINGGNNWSQVCHAGMVAGALAIHEHDPELAARVVERAVNGVPSSMRKSFSPDGAYPEGPSYWSYGTTFNVILLDCLRTVFGTMFGLEQAEGLDKTADYLAHATGPFGQYFNYCDSPEGQAAFEPAVYWLARQFKRADWTHRADKMLAPGSASAGGRKPRINALALLWASDQPDRDVAGPAPALDYLGGGAKPVAMFRSGWNDPKAAYLGVCAGTPNCSHGHMDIGSFVFDAGGVRWAVDLGLQQYESLESRGVLMWAMTQDSQRWTVFRLGNQSHNTLVIDEGRQLLKGFAGITRFQPGVDSPGCEIDLTPVYSGQVQSAVRKFMLVNRALLRVSDDLAGLAAQAKVRWQFFTRAKIAVDPAKPAEALLTLDRSRLSAKIVAPAGACWQTEDFSAPVREYDAPNPGLQRLSFELSPDASGSLGLVVELTPLP